ncbi:MAG: zinc ribbon domain-containing protein [Actinomycetota bacterium]
MICPECGSFQPDRAKFCGICGAGLSQDGLVESFLRNDPEHEIVLPRHRSPWFYLALLGIVLLALATLAGAGYLVYRIAWGEEEAGEGNGMVEDNTLDYSDPVLGFSISYPDNWTLEQGALEDGELAALVISLTASKNLQLRVSQLDPLVSIGGIEAIEEYLAEDATARITALGGQPYSGETSRPAGDQSGYGQEETQAPTGGETVPGETEESSGDIFESTRVSGLPAFYTEFTANSMGEETRFLLYYIVAGDSIFTFLGRAPSSEFKDVRPQFFAITGSFKWEETDGGEMPQENPDVGALPSRGVFPVITFS